MRRVSPLREFLSSLLFLCVCLCVCACTETQRERRGEGETQKTFMERYHTTNAKTPQGLTGTARREEGRERGRERESGREEHSVHCAAHVDMCEQGAKGARGAHHASHSLTHSVTSLVPLVPHLFCERERVRERKRPREREEKKRRTLAKTFFLQCLFFYTRSPISFFPPRPPPRHSS